MKDVPYQAESQMAANGIHLAYDIFGDPEAPPLLLIMAFTMPMIAWDDEYCRLLARRGYRVIRFDNRDIGHSTWLDDAGVPNMRALATALGQGTPVDVPYRLVDMAKDAVCLLDGLGIDSAHVAGMSMGGMIAQTMAIHFPDRMRTLVCQSTSMWILDPTLPAATGEAAGALTKAIPMDREGFIAGSANAWRIVGGTGMPMDEAFLRDRARRIFERGISAAGLARQMAAMMASGSRREALRSLRTKTLVLHGDADPLLPPAHAVATAETIPGAALHLVKGLGHDVPPAAWPELVDTIAQYAV